MSDSMGRTVLPTPRSLEGAGCAPVDRCRGGGVFLLDHRRRVQVEAQFGGGDDGVGHPGAERWAVAREEVQHPLISVTLTGRP